jgi:16S rRNA (uracil1498-N3)-methyltransferase
VLESTGKREARARVLARIVVDSESPLAITLAQGIARGEKMDLILQKATELGVGAHRARADRAHRGEAGRRTRRQARRALARRAGLGLRAERSRAPARAASADRAGPVPGRRKKRAPPGARSGAGESLAQLALAAHDSICLLVGPEGGLSERDLAAARAAGFTGLRLGPRILRTETAALAAISGSMPFTGTGAKPPC